MVPKKLSDFDRYDLWIVYDPCPDEHKLRETWVGSFDGLAELNKVKSLVKRVIHNQHVRFIIWHFGKELPF